MIAMLLQLVTAVFLLILPIAVAALPVNEIPVAAHVVVVVLENYGFTEIMNSDETPFIRDLARRGALFTHSTAIAHPSEPNYFALFSGSTQGVTDDAEYRFTAPTLAGALRSVGKTFVGYAEAGSPRRHNPWESFDDAAGVGRDFSAFPLDFSRLPTVSFVVPNGDDDMHNGSIGRADAWLRKWIGPYVNWASAHNSLLILTFDEDDRRENNRITTIFVGANVRSGRYDQVIDHLSVLRTIEVMYGLPALGQSAGTSPITGVWMR